jgi:3-phosphoshikimate 1-carboxyvinyltransferase
MHCLTNLHFTVDCTVTLPLSKSIANRLLVIRQLSGIGNSIDFDADASDIVTMQQLIHEIRKNCGDTNTIKVLDAGNAGTIMRFLTAVLAITPGRWIITGTERLKQRPIKPLTDALIHLGAQIKFKGVTGYPPLEIIGKPELSGGTVNPDTTVSSQFISALMMIGPVLKGGLTIDLEGEVISVSYIRMTQTLMQSAGADVSLIDNNLIIKEGKYTETDFSLIAEQDWSSAAFWFQIVALATKASVLLKGLRQNSIQGDSVLPSIFANLGVNSVFNSEGLLLQNSENIPVDRFDFDFTECPDLAQAVIATCAAMGIRGRFKGLKTLRVKETDRISALRNELSKLGYGIKTIDDEIHLNGEKPTVLPKTLPVQINCYDDHRMAMSLAPLVLVHENICFDDPGVVKKSYPEFWNEIAKAGIVFSERT